MRSIASLSLGLLISANATASCVDLSEKDNADSFLHFSNLSTEVLKLKADPNNESFDALANSAMHVHKSILSTLDSDRESCRVVAQDAEAELSTKSLYVNQLKALKQRYLSYFVSCQVEVNLVFNPLIIHKLATEHNNRSINEMIDLVNI